MIVLNVSSSSSSSTADNIVFVHNIGLTDVIILWVLLGIVGVAAILTCLCVARRKHTSKTQTRLSAISPKSNTEQQRTQKEQQISVAVMPVELDTDQTFLPDWYKTQQQGVIELSANPTIQWTRTIDSKSPARI